MADMESKVLLTLSELTQEDENIIQNIKQMQDIMTQLLSRRQEISGAIKVLNELLKPEEATISDTIK